MGQATVNPKACGSLTGKMQTVVLRARDKAPLVVMQTKDKDRVALIIKNLQRRQEQGILPSASAGSAASQTILPKFSSRQNSPETGHQVFMTKSHTPEQGATYNHFIFHAIQYDNDPTQLDIK